MENPTIREYGDFIQSFVNDHDSVVQNEHTSTVSLFNRQLRVLKMLVSAGVNIDQPYSVISELVDLTVWGIEQQHVAFHACKSE